MAMDDGGEVAAGASPRTQADGGQEPGNGIAMVRRGLASVAGVPDQDEMTNSILAYVAAGKLSHDGDASRRTYLRAINSRYWRVFYAIISAAAAQRRHTLEFSDEERLFMDIGLIDSRMLGGGGHLQIIRPLLAKLAEKGPAGCFYLSEWLAQSYQQTQLESTLSRDEAKLETDAAGKIAEMRGRVLSRLTHCLTGLPGIPLKVSEAMRDGKMDRGVIASGVEALRNPRRKSFLRRHNLWLLRSQVLEKAKARARGPNDLRLLGLLDELYVREWRDSYEGFIQGNTVGKPNSNNAKFLTSTIDSPNANVDAIMGEARQLRLRLALMDAIDGKDGPDMTLQSGGNLLGKADLAAFLPVAQTFDRSLAEIPPIIVAPGSGRGFFCWESGCLMVCLRPMVGVDDSIATALAWYRMLDDRFNRGGVLQNAYAKKFPGVVFHAEFPADYRAWLCHAVKGEISAMNPQRRMFFRDFIGPDISGPMLPANLRNIGPQTMAIIARRLEKQIAAGDKDVNLYRRLAAIYWQQGNIQAASIQYTAAMGLAPNDGETIFATGMFMRSNGDVEAANECFRFGQERAADSLWGIYCRDALENLL
ncbi:MAG: hypothetical protein LBU23_10595 [Planctomycetota bacterium]|jgi:hypothetical protein|nr:hypothetical protein [Planctomycetota bacterium]